MRFQAPSAISALFGVLTSLSVSQAVLLGAAGTIQLRPDAVHGKGVQFAKMFLGDKSGQADARGPTINFRTKDNGDIIDAVGELAEPRFTVYFKDEKEQDVSALGKLMIDQEKTIAFAFANGPAFVHPCEVYYGVRIRCDERQYMCPNDLGITDFTPI